MSSSAFLSWEDMQRLAYPPETIVLVPPPPLESMDMVTSVAGPPKAGHEWLNDISFSEIHDPGTDRMPTNSARVSSASPDPQAIPTDPNAERAAAETAEYGPGPVRFLASAIAAGAVLEYLHTPPKKDDDPSDTRRLEKRKNE